MTSHTVSIALALGLWACGGGAGNRAAATTPQTPAKPLYDRLGGVDAIKAVVHDFLGNVAADARINARFLDTDIPKLEDHLVNQICQATGGPCTYTGRSMREVHTGMSITEAEWGALVEDLDRSLDTFKVPQPEQDELIRALAGMHGDVVGR